MMNTPQPAWLAEAEVVKVQVLNQLQQMAPHERNAVPNPQGWSAAQVVAHLILVEELLVNAWHPAAQHAPAARPGLKGAVMVRTVNALMQTPLRIPTVPGLEPAGILELADLSERWQAARNRLPATLPANPAALWIVHPIFGPLSSPLMGAFLVAHLHHHLRQLKRKTR